MAELQPTTIEGNAVISGDVTYRGDITLPIITVGAVSAGLPTAIQDGHIHIMYED